MDELALSREIQWWYDIEQGITYVRTVLKVKDDGEILYSPVKEMCNFEWIKLLFTAIPTGTDQAIQLFPFTVILRFCSICALL